MQSGVRDDANFRDLMAISSQNLDQIAKLIWASPVSFRYGRVFEYPARTKPAALTCETSCASSTWSLALAAAFLAAVLFGSA